ncbi:hypothetical protein A0U40_08560 [[Bacillus] sp. KCTC 13219]|nr:hypothetical protein A0U40_08560 [[Bacillus] sp. KCTC 13219]
MIKKILHIFKVIFFPFVHFLIEKSFRNSVVFTYLFRNTGTIKNYAIYIPNETKSENEIFELYNNLILNSKIKKHFWVLDGSNRKFIYNKNTIIIKKNSIRYLVMLVKSKYIINENNLPHFYQKNKSQNIITILNKTCELDGKYVLTENIVNTDCFITNNEKCLLYLEYVKEIIPNIKIFNNINEITNFSYKRELKDNTRRNILIWAGGFSTNGITHAFINLSHNIDYKRGNFILAISKNDFIKHKENVEKLSANIKILLKSKESYSVYEYYFQKFISLLGLNSKIVSFFIPHNFFLREYHRLIGNIEVDKVIDFDGYTNFWTMLFALNNIDKKYIYLHSDMLADSNRSKAHRRGAKVYFNLYRYFDKLICVSEDSTNVNKLNLAKYAKECKFVNVNNVIDYKKILKNSELDSPLKYYFTEDTINFVNIARLSPEKNHKKLFEAFAKVKKYKTNIKLFIIGEGNQRNDLLRQIHELKMEGSIILLGEIDNPFPLLKSCDCFVLSSDYEGQSLVVLEALILRKNVISTDVTGVRSVLQNKYGEIVSNDIEGLTKGMLNFIDNKPEYKEFDYEEYNNTAILKFHKEILDS